MQHSYLFEGLNEGQSVHADSTLVSCVGDQSILGMYWVINRHLFLIWEWVDIGCLPADVRKISFVLICQV